MDRGSLEEDRAVAGARYVVYSSVRVCCELAKLVGSGSIYRDYAPAFVREQPDAINLNARRQTNLPWATVLTSHSSLSRLSLHNSNTSRIMSKTIETAVHSLVPRHSGTLPPELLSLASSLLAQSRTKCSNLKSVEEPARAFACANLACERLKTKLNLPNIEPRPPIPPKVYRKLYEYFDRTLLNTALSRKRTRQQTAREEVEADRRPLPQRRAPIKETTLRQFRTTKKGLKAAGKGGGEGRIPKWIAPVIRKFCEMMNEPRCGPSVRAGVETIIGSLRPVEGERFKGVKGGYAQLIVAVWELVEKSATKHVGKRDLKRAIQMLCEIREDEEMLAKVGRDEDDWDCWGLTEVGEDSASSESGGSILRLWQHELDVGGWLDMDWYMDIAQFDKADAQQSRIMEVRKRREDVMQFGLGTMRQPKNDHLTDAKRAKFAEWKVTTMARIDAGIARETFRASSSSQEANELLDRRSLTVQ